MTPQEKLKEIESLINSQRSYDESVEFYQLDWLIDRVKKLEEAIEDHNCEAFDGKLKQALESE